LCEILLGTLDKLLSCDSYLAIVTAERPTSGEIMTIAYWCVLAAIILPYFFTVLAKSGRGFNNSIPRQYLASLKGWRQRANWAQLNSFEALPGFIAGVIISQQLGVSQLTIDTLAIVFIIMRLLYGVCYIGDKASLRSLCWAIALGCVISLFIVSV